MSQKTLTLSKKLYLNQMVGVLSTHSLDVPGYPFGSIVPYGFDRFLRPIILISRLAQHTKNINATQQISLFVSDVGSVGFEDVQTCSRLTILADVEELDDPQELARYARFYPDADVYHRDLDFNLFRLVPHKVRFIGGFGKIHWVNKEALFTENPFSAGQEKDIIDHMNTDHADTFNIYCEKAGVSVPDNYLPEMVSVDAYGFHLRIGRRLVHIGFLHAVTTPMEARSALIGLLRD